MQGINVLRFSKAKPKMVSPEKVSNTIRILAFSDWRVPKISNIFEFIQSIEPIDFVLYAGDDIHRFEEGECNYFSELAEYTKSKQVLAVIGNDDLYMQKSTLKAKGVHDLYNQSYIYKNFAFIGLEASTSRPARFKHEEKDYRKHLKYQFNQVQGKRLIVLSHTPPFGVLDRGIRFAKPGQFTQHIGSTALKRFIEAKSVDLVICGHCHSQGGATQKLGNTVIANVSSHDNISAKGKFAIIELAKNGTCDIEWHDTHELRKSSLMQIYGIGPTKSEKLIKSGIRTIEQLVDCEDLTRLSRSSGSSAKHLRLLQMRGKSILRNEIYQIAPFNIDPKKAIFFDIETDIACKRVWLVGLQIDDRFIQLYADTWGEEKEILVEFAQILGDFPDHTLISFSGTNFDYRITLGAMQRHGMNTSYLSSHSHTDLCTLLRRCYIFPNQRFALKYLGSFLEYPFKNSDLDGLAVALAYHRHSEAGTPLDDKIFEYNQDDVQVLPFIISKVRAHRFIP